MANRFIQNYKNLRSARREYKQARADLDAYYQSIIRDVSLEEFIWNVEMLKAFCKSLPQDRSTLAQMKNYVEAFEINGRIFRATTCFFKLNQKMFEDTIFEQTLTLKDVGKCANNHSNGTIIEKCCADCPHFEELVKYQSLWGVMNAAKQKREDAKQQLFSVLWKQNTKGK